MSYIRRGHSLSKDKSNAGLADGLMTVCQKLAGLHDFGRRDQPDIFLPRTVLFSHSNDCQLGPRGSECVAWDPGGRCPRLSLTSSSDVGKLSGETDWHVRLPGSGMLRSSVHRVVGLSVRRSSAMGDRTCSGRE